MWRMSTSRAIIDSLLDSPMDLIRSHRSEIRRSLHGPAWHGPALLELLADVTPKEAHTRVFADAHTIAELAEHALAWVEEVTKRLGGATAGTPERGDWPEQKDQSESAWRARIESLRVAGEELDALLATLPADRLLDVVATSEPDIPDGGGVRVTVMLQGLAQHNAYHGGQVALLKKALRVDAQ